MANMSYCRFQNTLHDFIECVSVMNEGESFTDMNLSEDETRAMNRLAKYAKLYLNRYTDLQEQAEYDFARNKDNA
jgi:hypothetical protein